MSIFAKYTGQRVSSLPAGYMQAEAQRANLISEGVKDFGRAIEGYAQQKAEDRIRDERIEALVGASTDPAYQRESSLDAALVKAKETDNLMLEERRRQIREEQAAARQSVLDKQTQALMDNERARLAEQAHGKAMTAHLEKHKRGVNALRGFAVPNVALRALGATAKMKKDQALASQAAATEAEAALPKFLEDKAKESNALVYTDAQDAVHAEPWKYAEAIESPEKLQEDMVNAVGPALLKKFQSGSATKGDKLVLLEKLENFSADKRQRGSLQGQRAQQLLDLGDHQLAQQKRTESNNEAMAEFTGLIMQPIGSEDVPWNRALPGEPDDWRHLDGPSTIEHKYTRAREWIDQNRDRLGPANTAQAHILLEKRRERDAFTMASDEVAGLPEAAREQVELREAGWKDARALDRDKIKLGQDLDGLTTFSEIADTYTDDVFEGGKLVARRFMQKVPGGGIGNDVVLGERRGDKFNPAPGIATSGTSADTLRFFREKDQPAAAPAAEDSLRNKALNVLRKWQTELGPQGATALQGQINRLYKKPVPSGLLPSQHTDEGTIYTAPELPDPVGAAGDVDAKLVQISGVTGSFEGTASSDKEAADFREALVAAEEAIPLLRKLYRMAEARDESGKKIFDATSNPWSEEGLRERGEATAARNILVGKLKLALTGGGAMSDQDVKRILDTVPNPYEFFSTDTASVAKIETLTKTLLDSVDSRARSYGIRRSGGFSDARKLLLAKDSELSTPSATTPAAPLPPAKFEMRGGKLVPVKPNPEQK